MRSGCGLKQWFPNKGTKAGDWLTDIGVGVDKAYKRQPLAVIS